MIVLPTADAGEQDFLLVRLIVSVGVGENENIFTGRNDNAVVQYADSVRRIDVASLIKNFTHIGLSIVVGIFEDEDAIALGTAVTFAAIVHHLANPYPSTMIDVDVCRTPEERTGSEK